MIAAKRTALKNNAIRSPESRALNSMDQNQSEESQRNAFAEGPCLRTNPFGENNKGRWGGEEKSGADPSPRIPIGSFGHPFQSSPASGHHQGDREN
jgi:hypothetical protein